MRASSFKTSGYHGYNVSFSPFQANRLAVATSQNFGLAGKGSLFVLDHFPDDWHQPIKAYRVYRWPRDGMFDVTWSEANPSILWSCSGDGSIQIYDLDDSGREEPITVIKGHEREVCNLDSTQYRSDGPHVLSSSWDGSVKMWDGVQGQLVAAFLQANLSSSAIVYGAVWSPLLSATFASVGADGFLKIWNIKDRNTGGARPSLVIRASQTEILSVDWCKYNENILVTGAVDGLINCWDLRSPQAPLITLQGHERAVKKVKFSPFDESVIGSVSYDFTTRLWDFKQNLGNAMSPRGASPLLKTYHNHAEFAYGLDFNLRTKDVLVDCGWDQSVVVFSAAPEITSSSSGLG